ncbi:MAG: hypothetical protein ABR507_03345 [Actinomycetota bacterium]
MNKSDKSIRLIATAIITILAATVPFISSADIGHQPVSEKCESGRQTEDPNSPPCQPYFEGDNGGQTSPGVTGDEVRVLLYLNTAITVNGSDAEQSPPKGTYCDVDLLDCNGDGKPDADPHVYLRVANTLSRYFNARFQTYNRHVHFYAYYGADFPSTAQQRAEAEDNYLHISPFAVVDVGSLSSFKADYYDAMARHGVMVFSGVDTAAQSGLFFSKHAPYVWNWWPDAEHRADLYANYVCDKVKVTNVTEGPFAGQPRTYAIYTTADYSYPVEQLIGQLVRQKVQSCGILIDNRDVFTYPHSGYLLEATAKDQAVAANNALRMRRGNYNTVLYAGGSEAEISKATERLGYLPQWIVLGDGKIDGGATGNAQGQIAWSHAWVVSNQSQVGAPEEQPGYRAYNEMEPNSQDASWAPVYYAGFFMIFDAIQLAGPRLEPQSVDTGLHAIAPYQSTALDSPALFFDPGDYTFVKDALETWWDPLSFGESGSITGCYRVVPPRNTSSSWMSSTSSGLNGSEKDGHELCSAYVGPTDVKAPLFS